MKTALRIVLLVIIAAFVSFCNKNETESTFYPSELNSIKKELASSFDSLDVRMGVAVTELSFELPDTTNVRNQLVNLLEQSSFVLELAFITPEGIMRMIEPPFYISFEGSDVSHQAHILKTFETRKPVYSQVFQAVEGYQAAVDVHPVIRLNQVLGGISALFRPVTFLTRTISPHVDEQDFELWVMEKGGRVIYDQDEAEIGLNVLTDSLYTDFPELIAAAKLMDSLAGGETFYSYYQTGTRTKVVKHTFWVTLKLYDMEWKIVWAKAE